MTDVCCRNCELMLVQPDKDGKVRIRNDNMYKCLVNSELYLEKLPFATRRQYNIDSSSRRFAHVSPHEGVGCTGFKRRGTT